MLYLIMEVSGWNKRDFTLGRPQWDGCSDIWHPTASSREGVDGEIWLHVHLTLVSSLAKVAL